MSEIGIVRQVAGEWRPSQGVVYLRLQSDRAGQSHEVLIAPSDIQILVTLLLTLAGQAGRSADKADDPDMKAVQPLGIDSIGLGEAHTGDAILELEVGAAALAFALPASACARLGQTLLTLSAAQNAGAN